MEPRSGHALAPSVRDFVPAGHLAHFIRDLVAQEFDLSFSGGYAEEKGYPPYHPTMMTALLLYSYCLLICRQD